MTGTTLPIWPAFALGGHSVPERISYERGVWGKVHGARSDYRWIATTSSFTPASLRLEDDLRLGTEDVPRKATHWRNLGDQCLAMVSYPSRASDTAGRTDFLEKQVLAWRRPPEIPAALGALVLLPQVAQADDSVWWERRTQHRWSDEDETLILPPPYQEPFTVSVDEIISTMAAGIAELVQAISVEPLADLYSHLLAGHRAVPLPGLSAPLGATALAALLLPLPRSVADGLSLAGWLPSQRLPDLDEIRRCWNGVLGGATLPPPPSSVPSAEQRRQAGTLARALLANDPSALANRTVPAKTRTVAPGGRPIQLAMWGPPSSGKTALLAKLYLEDQDSPWEIFPTEKSLQFIQNMRASMRSSNLFPKATTGGTEQIEYLFRHRETGAKASLRMEDRAGAESEKLSDGLRRQLGEADGLVLLFDPDAEGITLEGQVWKTLEHVHVASGRGVQKDDRPIAVCVSKADLLIETVDDLRSARDDPNGFVRRHDKMGLVRALDRFCSNYCLFPVSAAGILLRYGVVQPVVFYDEALLPRIGPGGQLLHVMTPFAWLLDQVTSR